MRTFFFFLTIVLSVNAQATDGILAIPKQYQECVVSKPDASYSRENFSECQAGVEEYYNLKTRVITCEQLGGKLQDEYCVTNN